MFTRSAAGLVLAFALVTPALAAPPAAPAQTVVLAPFHAFIDAFNTGDMTAAAAPYAPDAVIVDEVPPFEWRGNAFAGWSADLKTGWAAEGITNAHVAISAPTQFAAAKGMAYAIFPAHLSFTQKGKAGSEDGFFAVTLKQMEKGWRISSWAWTTKH